MIDLSSITYLSIVGNKSASQYTDIDSILKIGIHSSKNIKFGKKIIYTYENPSINTEDFEIVIIPEIKYELFSDFVLLNYNKMFDTDYMINFHHDGFIQNPNSWDESFLQYDYIGAPINYSNFLINGNGGFSLRSKKMTTEVCNFYKNNQFLKNIPEDIIISYFLKNQLERKNIKFAPLEECVKFSLEHHLVFNGVEFKESFGFHEIEKLFNIEEKNRRKNLYSNIF
jgi:hypothetical protein